MAQETIDRLIVNSPYEEPARHWSYDRATRLFDLAEGRRPAGYVVASQDSRAFDDPGTFVEIPLVNQIRARVKKWRNAGYPGVTGVTRRLLRHWTDPEEFAERRFFFCQIEAVETLIWLAEASPSEKVGIDIPTDGSDFQRLCAKMATGSGKTVDAWSLSAESGTRGIARSDIEQATKWIGGLDRINRTRGILACYDFSATPFVPSGKQSSEEALFDWIVNDFGLNDAIEAGLVKTPRVVIRDDAVPDAKTYKSRLYHIYNDEEVKDNLNRKAKPADPLPDLVLNGYYLKAWKRRSG